MKHTNAFSFRFRIAAMAGLTLLCGITSRAATYYVDTASTAASDANSGSSALPWKTLQNAINKAQAGDTVLVMPGVYSQALTIQRSGTAAGPITFRSSTPLGAVIDGTGISAGKFIDWHGAPSGGTDKNYITFDGFEVRNTRQWAFWIEGGHNAIINCKIHDCGYTNSGVGILVRQGDYNVISSNEVYRAGWNGINCENSNYTTISFNRSHDNPRHFGINVFPETSGTQTMETGNNIINNVLYNCMGGIYTRYQQNNLIAGNLIYNNSQSGIFLHSGGTGPSTYAAHTKLYNNTIVGNGYHGIWDVSATYLEIRNNIFVNQATTDKYYEIYVGSGLTTGHVIDGNLYYPNSSQVIYWGGTKYSLAQMKSVLAQEAHGLAGDPKFTNPAGSDYTLTTGSPAIDAGLNLAAEGVVVDMKLTPRPQGSAFDIGAYEFAAQPATNVAPLAPTGLHTIP